jgi:hypothetical protein
MSKLKCLCGNTIDDQADNLPYKGYLIPDSELDKTSEILSYTIDSLSEATKKSKRLEWIKDNFLVPPYPTNLSDSSMIHDIISSLLIEKKQDVFECGSCGRIAIQVRQTNHFKYYKPESDDSKGILNRQENLLPT